MSAHVSVTGLNQRTLLLRYAAVALGLIGGIEWLLGRTVSRIAASPTLDGTPRNVIESLGRVGIFFLPIAFVAAASILFITTSGISIGTAKTNSHRGVALGMFLSVFGALTVASYFLPVTTWLATSFNIVSLIALVWVYIFGISSNALSRPARIAISLTMLAYLGWFYYIVQEELSTRLGWDVSPVLVLNIGELVALIAPFAFFVAVGVPNQQWKHPRRWILPVVAALAFAAGNIADMVFDQGFTGVFTLWSVGFTHFLPWPLYALGLAAYVYSMLTCFASGTDKAAFANPNTGLGLLLLLYAGYNLQLTYQHLIALLAMLLFTGLAKPFSNQGETDQSETISDNIPLPVAH